MMTEKKEKQITPDDREVEVVNQAQLGLQGYDRGVVTREELGVIMGINLDTGVVTKSWDHPMHYYQAMLQCYDRELITEDVLRKCVLGLGPKSVVAPEEEDK